MAFLPLLLIPHFSSLHPSVSSVIGKTQEMGRGWQNLGATASLPFFPFGYCLHDRIWQFPSLSCWQLGPCFAALSTDVIVLICLYTDGCFTYHWTRLPEVQASVCFAVILCLLQQCRDHGLVEHNKYGSSENEGWKHSYAYFHNIFYFILLHLPLIFQVSISKDVFHDEDDCRHPWLFLIPYGSFQRHTMKHNTGR